MKDKGISQLSYKLTHELYESAGGKYRTTGANNMEAIDSELFMRCFQRVEEILEENK
jgi:hypothetical protein